VRRTLIDFGVATIEREIGFEQFDAVAGGETAGIPFAAWMADRLMLPMQYVRKKPKGFGRNAQIEGHLEAGDRVLLVEDMTTDGRSKVNFCKALREAGATVEHVLRVLLLRHLSRIAKKSSAISASPCIRSPPGGTCWKWRRRAAASTRASLQGSREIHEEPGGLVEGAWRRRAGGGVIRGKCQIKLRM
jgi:orotate phosphoribosyltransferase